jgi:hypothetical protein
LIDIYADEDTSHLGPLTRKFTLARLQHHVIPMPGTKKVTEVGPAGAGRMIRAVISSKTAKDEKIGLRAHVIVKDGRDTTAKVMRDLSAHSPSASSPYTCLLDIDLKFAFHEIQCHCQHNSAHVYIIYHADICC